MIYAYDFKHIENVCCIFTTFEGVFKISAGGVKREVWKMVDKGLYW